MDKNRVRQTVRSLGKFKGIEQVVHLVPVPRLTQALEHVEQRAVHRAIALCEEVRINGLIPEIKIPCVSVVGRGSGGKMTNFSNGSYDQSEYPNPLIYTPI